MRWPRYKVLLTSGYARRAGVRLIFDRRDVWVGVYFDRGIGGVRQQLYICLLPMLPINVWWQDKCVGCGERHGGACPMMGVPR